jgi:hypothetical protein
MNDTQRDTRIIELETELELKTKEFQDEIRGTWEQCRILAQKIWTIEKHLDIKIDLQTFGVQKREG